MKEGDRIRERKEGQRGRKRDRDLKTHRKIKCEEKFEKEKR